MKYNICQLFGLAPIINSIGVSLYFSLSGVRIASNMQRNINTTSPQHNEQKLFGDFSLVSFNSRALQFIFSIQEVYDRK